MNSVGWYVFIVWLLVRSLPAPKSFGGVERGADRGLCDRAQGGGGVVLVAFELDLPDAVCGGLKAQGGDGCFGGEGAAAEVLAVRAGVGEDLAAG